MNKYQYINQKFFLLSIRFSTVNICLNIIVHTSLFNIIK